MIINTILIIIILFVVLYLYYKYKYQFWSRQPVFHYHNIKYWLNPPGIIQHGIPKIDKYYNPEIQFDTFMKLKTEKKALFITFIKSHFMPHKTEQYTPTQQSIIPYFEHNNDSSYISLYIQKVNNSNRIIASMTTRPLDCVMNNNKLKCHYVDHLCVHKEKRKRGIAPEIIYSHYVNHRKSHKNVVFLFKREGDSTMIVPLCIYKNYGFDMKYWYKNISFDQPNINVVLINDSNLKLILDIWNSIDSNFECVIKPNISNIKHLLESENIYISVVMVNNVPVSIYVFRKTYTTYNGENSLEFIASYNDVNMNPNEKMFTLGALISIDKIRKISPLRYLFIENISNNFIIIKHILERYTSFVQITTSYYFYNFGLRPLMSTDVFMVN
uniref:glycylpeptide N-tetradecanoyltransferase n=1 Tax=viral metagenome TaxID=1070528 RepID=A0A6C0C4Q0_9ZZZZ